MCWSTHYYPPNSQVHEHGDGDNHHHNWKLECCKCELPSSSFSISEVELLVDLDGHVPIRERVAIPSPNKKPMPVVNKYKMKNSKHRTKKLKLEDIPEETELHDDGDANPELEEACIHLEMDLEVLRRSLDMGIWVLCLGLGFMVSRPSITKFRSLPKFSRLIQSLS